MPKVKVQKRRVKAKDKPYTALWIGLPKSLVEALRIEAGDSLEVFVEAWRPYPEKRLIVAVDALPYYEEEARKRVENVKNLHEKIIYESRQTF